MITSINHAGVVVSDLEKAIDFYRDVIGLKIIRKVELTGGPISRLIGYDNTHLKAAHMGTGEGTTVELIQYVNPAPAERPSQERNVLGASHVALTVDDIQESYERVVSGGAQKLNPPQEVAPGAWRCYLQDPDGNWVELVENRA